jgi:hypothetical protein
MLAKLSQTRRYKHLLLKFSWVRFVHVPYVKETRQDMQQAVFYRMLSALPGSQSVCLSKWLIEERNSSKWTQMFTYPCVRLRWLLASHLDRPTELPRTLRLIWMLVQRLARVITLAVRCHGNAHLLSAVVCSYVTPYNPVSLAPYPRLEVEFWTRDSCRHHYHQYVVYTRLSFRHILTCKQCQVNLLLLRVNTRRTW